MCGPARVSTLVPKKIDYCRPCVNSGKYVRLLPRRYEFGDKVNNFGAFVHVGKEGWRNCHLSVYK